MKTAFILIATALAAAACDPQSRRPPDRTATTGTSTGIGAPQDAAPRYADPSRSNTMADGGRAADDTGLNERDRAATTTPMDQGSSAAETDITATIRRGIMADERLSFNGKNVKVITVGSKVTLRGPVKSSQAKVAIAALASRTAGVSEVDNQLEVEN